VSVEVLEEVKVRVPTFSLSWLMEVDCTEFSAVGSTPGEIIDASTS